MKIAHIGPEYYPAIGGVGQVISELALRQVKDGHEVHVYVPAWDKHNRINKYYENLDGVNVHRCRYWFKLANFMTFWPSLFFKLLNEKFDIIHSHLFAHPHFVISSLIAKIRNIPHIHTTHCPWSNAPRSLIGNIGTIVSYNLFSRLSLKGVKKIISITPWENKYIIQYGGKKEQIVNLPNGVSEMFFKKVKSNEFRKKLGIKKDVQVVLFFGRLNFTKGPDKFVEIAKEILKKENNVVFVIRGPDEGFKDLVKKRIGNEKRIILLEETRNKKEILEMYQASDIFVMPSYREGLPLTLFEAMASGLPIVATPVNGIPYEIKDKKNGFLIEYGNNKKFASKILDLIKNFELRQKISEKNINYSKRYSWNNIYKKTMDLYKSII